MNVKDFHATNAGKVIRTPTGYAALVPAKLPPTLTYDNPLVISLSRADAALSELSGLGRYLPNPHLLIAPYVRREAVLSSRIEGTKASLSDLLIDEMEHPKDQTEDDDVREVRNYVTAMGHGLDRLEKLPLSLRLVREIHAHLMKGGSGRPCDSWVIPPKAELDGSSW